MRDLSHLLLVYRTLAQLRRIEKDACYVCAMPPSDTLYSCLYDHSPSRLRAVSSYSATSEESRSAGTSKGNRTLSLMDYDLSVCVHL